MRKIFAAACRAALCFLIYPAVQIAVSTVTSAIVSAQIAAEAMAAGEAVNTADAYDQTLGRLADLSAVMILISGVTTLFFYWLLLLVQGRRLCSEISLRKIRPGGALPVLLLGTAFELLSALALEAFPFPPHWTEPFVRHTADLTRGNPLAAWTAIVLAAPAVEETVFRGFVYSRLKSGMSPLSAALLTALLFAVMHGTLLQAICMFFLGLLLTWVLERFHSLLVCILLHASFNLTGLLLPLLPPAADGAALLALPAAAALCAAALFWTRHSSLRETHCRPAGNVIK